ncbi:hypothetical protein FAES_3101 [Fibrella aestuarina BUZ 2]|uniref:Uncharacterized protein n=1 Tax=Fibrella aestuarina BUZ 2 TaxID=1166018 RepID=I0KAF7_9BACT|nr:hypothetical protein FAES_3101 [Fibrella aestuarina BUZ 2]
MLWFCHYKSQLQSSIVMGRECRRMTVYDYK